MSALPDGVEVHQTDIDTYVWWDKERERALIHAVHFPVKGFGWTVHALNVDGTTHKQHVAEGGMDAFAAEWCGRVLAGRSVGMSDIELPEGVIPYTLDGERPHTTYRLGDTVILAAQDSVAHPGMITAVVYGAKGIFEGYCIVRVTPTQLPNLLAVLADLHRTAVTA